MDRAHRVERGCARVPRWWCDARSIRCARSGWPDRRGCQGRVAAGRPARPGELPQPGPDRRRDRGARSQLGSDGGRRLIGSR